MSVITLSTDFGLSDPYVGIMKGVILSVNPDVRIVDISHGIGPQDIAAGAYTIFSACRYFPPETIHVVVVDPGVGTGRRIVAARCRKQIFIAPDNGVLTHVMVGDGIEAAVSIENPDCFIHPVSRTFHGRDIFAPAAAHLSAGRKMDDLGPAISPDDLVRMDVSRPALSDDGILAGTVIMVDRFGNLISNISRRDVHTAFGSEEGLSVRIGTCRIEGVSAFYGEVSQGAPLALFGSGDLLEISVCAGNANQYFGLGRQAPVQVFKSSP